ncbi:MAG: HD domain-containing protein [Gammaproteobacteria bacterium]|nr:HD domain-containing protein [Gammaproteobacteria bacterium]
MFLKRATQQTGLFEQPEALLRYLFARPLFVAIAIALFIHFLKAFNYQWNSGANYLLSLSQSLGKSPVIVMGEIILPFLIPLLVIVSGRKVIAIRQQNSLAIFPELNPDIVIKTSLSGHIEYINPAARQFLNDTSISVQDANRLLPAEFAEIIGSAIRNNKNKLGIEHHIEGHVIDYTINSAPNLDAVFIAGRDITHRRGIERRLHDSQNLIREMSELVDQIFNEYDPLSFNLEDHFTQIVKTFLHNDHMGNAATPKFVYLASLSKNDAFVGHIYFGEEDAVKISADIFETLWKPLPSNEQRQQNAVYFNIEDSQQTPEEFQQDIDPKIREFTGNVHRYAMYRSGHVAIIAFYEGDRINQFDAMVLKTLAIYSNALLRISLENKATEEAFIYAIEALARASETNDQDTGSHINRINEYCRVLARELNQPDNFVNTIAYSAQMHDVGKIHTPANILKKPGILNEDEYNVMKQHTIAGARILGNSPRLKMAAEIARYHHEKFDGSGYPCGLSGEEIPLAARIVAIVDVYDALRQRRVYKDAMSHNEAVHIICNGDERTKPHHFDPQILEAFLRVQDQFDSIFSRYQD